MIKRRELSVRNNPGIYKRLELDEESGKWEDTGKYRAIRRTVIGSEIKRECGIFDSVEDAKAFRLGEIEKAARGNNCPRNTLIHREEQFTFGKLVEQWKPFHFLQLARSTQQTYEKRLPNLDFLKECPVEGITTAVVDQLVANWVETVPKESRRFTFEKELNLLKVVLNFYRRRINAAYVMPVLLDHYKAADIAKRADQGVQSLTQEQLALFLEELKTSKSPIFYSMAVAQFCLGLRIGELCGLNWPTLDLESRVARIEWTIDWDQITWEPRIKQRPKNGKVRVLVIPEILAQELERLKAVRDPHVPFVFHCNGKPMNRQTVAKAYNRALGRLGFDHVRGTHMLRKTSATLANEVTGDFYAVSKLMDHSSPNVTLRYVAQTSAQKHKVADALNSVLRSPQGPATKTHDQPSVPQRSPASNF